MEKLSPFDREKGGFSSWLQTVTLNKLCDRRKRKTPDLLGSGVGELDGEEADTTELFAEDEYRRHLTPRAMELARSQCEKTTGRACCHHVAHGRPRPALA